jgi:hypothetical protein
VQARVVDHDVDAAEPLDRRRCRGFHPLLIGNVTVHRDRLTACRNQFGRSAFGHVDVDIGEHHTCALGDQRPRERPAETDRTAGDHRRAIFKPHHTASRYSGLQVPRSGERTRD